MNSLVKKNSNLEKRGRTIYKNNDHFQKIAHLMEHPEFRQFTEKYMNDWDTFRAMIMFMKIYKAIEENSTTVLTPYEKLAVLEDIMRNSQMRNKICKGMSDWLNNKLPISSLSDKNHNKEMLRIDSI